MGDRLQEVAHQDTLLLLAGGRDRTGLAGKSGGRVAFHFGVASGPHFVTQEGALEV